VRFQIFDQIIIPGPNLIQSLGHTWAKNWAKIWVKIRDKIWIKSGPKSGAIPGQKSGSKSGSKSGPKSGAKAGQKTGPKSVIKKSKNTTANIVTIYTSTKITKKRNDLKFCNELPCDDLYVSTVPKFIQI